MPAKDFFHDAAKQAIINDGWEITDEPLSLKWKERDLFVDFEAEKVMVAEKAGRLIAVEVKSFIGASEMRDLHNAIGQYQIYRSVMLRTHPKHTLYLAISNEVYEKLFVEDVGSLAVADAGICMVVFDAEKEVIAVFKWVRPGLMVGQVSNLPSAQVANLLHLHRRSHSSENRYIVKWIQ